MVNEQLLEKDRVRIPHVPPKKSVSGELYSKMSQNSAAVGETTPQLVVGAEISHQFLATYKLPTGRTANYLSPLSTNQTAFAMANQIIFEFQKSHIS